MFKANSKPKTTNFEKIDTFINSNVKIAGTVTSTGTIRIDCEVIGDVIGEEIIIGETGNVKGNIKCNDIIISGKSEGNINCKNKIHIKSSGSQMGDIEYSFVVIDEGAKFEGNCKMLTDNIPAKEIIEKVALTDNK